MNGSKILTDGDINVLPEQIDNGNILEFEGSGGRGRFRYGKSTKFKR